MSIINRVTTWTSNQLLTSSVLNGEFNNLVNFINNVDSGSTSWDTVQATTINATSALQLNGTSFVFTPWAAYTPTITGIGTASYIQFFWKQTGDTIFVNGHLGSGTPTAVTLSITLPNSTLINTSKIAASATPLLGMGYTLLHAAGPTNTDSVPLAVFYDGASNTTVFVSDQVGTGVFVKHVASGFLNTSDFFSINFSYPI